MAYSYNYNLGDDTAGNPGNVKVQNVVIGYYKKTGKVVCEFDARGLDWNTGDANNITASVLYGGAVKKTQDLTVTDIWKRQTVEWEAGKDAEDSTCQNLQNLGSVAVTIRVDDENDSTTDTAHNVIIDLDPSEYHLTLISPPSFGDDSTPDIVWSLTDLFSEQKMSPVITVGASTANSMTVTFTDTTTVSGLSAGYVNLNGVTYSESSLVMNSADAGKAYWKKADKYTITAPTMSAGDNTFTLALTCTTI